MTDDVIRPERAKRAARPGIPVRGSASGRPIMALLDLLGQRWVLRVLWELREATLTFRALQEASGGISPSVLNGRLADLREAGFVELSDEGYRLTALGLELVGQLVPLTLWSERWASEMG